MSEPILVVDDNPMVAAVITRWLEPAGYEVQVADTGPGAIAMAATTAYGLVLLDVLLPGMDGREVADELKSNAMSASVPIVLLTGLVTPEIKDKAKRFRAAGFVSKETMNREEFVGTVARILAAHQG